MLFSFAQQVNLFNKMLKTKIMASGINNLTDARYFAAREVEWLGFRLDGSPTATISVLAAKAIAEWVDGVKIVGEFEFADAEKIAAANDLLHFDAVWVGMFTPAKELEKLPSLTFIKEVVVESTTTEAEIVGHFREYEHCCAHFLLDFTKSGISWAMLKGGGPLTLDFLTQLFSRFKVILALDFLPDEANDVIETLQPEGLSLTGGGEERVGFKSFDELDAILDRLEVAV